jgi:RNA polymerase sigma factor (sigma-70 family)
LAITHYTQEALIEALKQHSGMAYQHLYHNYKGALYHAILQIIPNEETANDLLQDTFVQIWNNIDKYDPEKGRLFTWMLKLCRNVCINHTRLKNFKVHNQNESIENYVSSIEKESQESTSTNHIGLRRQVHQLRAEWKEVIELSYFQGYKQEEIATILNIPVGTVKTRLRNGIIALRKQFL